MTIQSSQNTYRSFQLAATSYARALQNATVRTGALGALDLYNQKSSITVERWQEYVQQMQNLNVKPSDHPPLPELYAYTRDQITTAAMLKASRSGRVIEFPSHRGLSVKVRPGKFGTDEPPTEAQATAAWDYLKMASDPEFLNFARRAYQPTDICGVRIGNRIGVHWPIHATASVEQVADNLAAIGTGYSNVLVSTGSSPVVLKNQVEALKSRGITPVARVWTEAPAAKWDDQTIEDMITAARKAHEAGFELIQLGGNEPNYETGMTPNVAHTADERAECLELATTWIARALSRAKTALPQAKIGSPAILAGPPDAIHSFSNGTFLAKLAEKYASLGVKPDWSATHTYAMAHNGVMNEAWGANEGEFFGIPELSTEGGGFDWQPDTMKEAMKKCFERSANGKTSLLWMDYDSGYAKSALNGDIRKGTGLDFYAGGLGYYRDCFELTHPDAP